MKPGGFAGRVLYVDLSAGRVETVSLDPAQGQKYLGGLGLNLALIRDKLPQGVDALAPESPLVLGAGPLVGTNLPSTSRVYAVAKLPTTGTVGWCGAGGVSFGYLLKNAGYDHIVITGRAEEPVFLKIVDDRVEICRAGFLWGLGVDSTCDALRVAYGRPAGVLAIGLAGENLVRFSMAYIDKLSTLGRGGLGAVFGSKNLKAVVVQGSRGVSVADRKTFRKLADDFLEVIRTYPFLKEWQRLGMVKSFPLIEESEYEGMRKRRLACVSCPLGCKDLVEIPSGPFKGLLKGTSSVVNLYTPMLYGFKDYRESIRLMVELDSLGLDMFEFFGLMKTLAKAAADGDPAAGRLTPTPDPTSLDSMLKWAELISRREGPGAIPAEGFPALLDYLGRDASAPALVKGMHPYTGPGAALPWDYFGTMELGQVLDPRGPHIGSGGSPTYFARRPPEAFRKHLARMGVPPDTAEQILKPGPDGVPSLNVGRLLKYSHAWFAILGSLGVCARAQVNRFYRAELCARFYEAVTGFPTDLDALRRGADRVWTLFRQINVEQGLDKNEAEAFPEQWFQAPGFKNYLTEEPLSLEEAEGMRAEYYREWGWDPETGRPTEAGLAELGLTPGS